GRGRVTPLARQAGARAPEHHEAERGHHTNAADEGDDGLLAERRPLDRLFSEQSHTSPAVMGRCCAARPSTPIRSSARIAAPIGPATELPMPFSPPLTAAATSAAAGSVSSHAIAIRPATPQRTSARRLPTPEPSTEPDTMCVVESG